MPTLKRGQGMSTEYKDWNSSRAEWVKWPPSSPAGSSVTDWEFLPVFVPNGKEQIVGVKKFFGEEYMVFKCLDDTFMAQPKNICELPNPSDLMKVLSILPNDLTNVTPSQEVLVFNGTNWKLASDRKWKKCLECVDVALLEKCGEKTINGISYIIYRDVDRFLAS